MLLLPFIFVFLVIFSFFKFSEEYQKSKATIGYRKYSPFAEWKFRDFNEFPHLLARRLISSRESAHQYVSQFSKNYLVILARYIIFETVAVFRFFLGH